jgi:excisionase family DNA binding protein
LVHDLAASDIPSQALDNTQDPRSPAVEDLPPDATDGAGGTAFPQPVAADSRRTEFLRPEDLLPVSAVAERLGVSMATVHAAINAGELRWVLWGSVRRVRPEDLEAYVLSRDASRTPAGEDWCTVADLMRTTGFSRSKAYRVLARSDLPFQVFAGTRYFQSEDVAIFLRAGKTPQRMPP